jgi:hypothetical protein
VYDRLEVGWGGTMQDDAVSSQLELFAHLLGAPLG